MESAVSIVPLLAPVPPAWKQHWIAWPLCRDQSSVVARRAAGSAACRGAIDRAHCGRAGGIRRRLGRRAGLAHVADRAGFAAGNDLGTRIERLALLGAGLHRMLLD